MNIDHDSLSQILERIEHLTELAERAMSIAASCSEDARIWQEAHDIKSAKLISMTTELQSLVEALRWVSVTRRVVLWIAAGIISVTAALAWIHSIVDQVIRHK